MVDPQAFRLTLEDAVAAFSDRYRIESVLGAGGMATVFAARDDKLGRRVAVKVLHPDLGANVGIERFMRETEITAGLNHPHIVPVLDRGEANGYLYFVMSLIEGETLRDVIRRDGPMDPADAVRLLRDVVDGLEHAHSLGVVHRDIKPENVLVSGRHAMVTDFGIAKTFALPSAGPELTRLGVALGTPQYMSPEQATGEDPVDHRSDIYAVGVLAYEMLTGVPPFTGTSRQVLVAHIVTPPKPITEFTQSVPGELVAIVTRCLAKEPEDRYQATRDLLEDIESQAKTGSRAVLGVRGRGLHSAHPRTWAAAAVVAVLTVAGMVALGNRGTGPPVGGGDRIVVAPFENRTGDASLDEAGYMAAEWVTQGLHREEIGNAMPAASVSRMLTALGDDIGDPVAALAEAADADIVVSGAIRKQGDTVILSSDIVDVRTGNVIGVTEQVRTTDLSEAISTATQRIQGLLATHFNFGETFFTMSPPPNMEVYRELLAGREAFYRGDFADATARFERITDLAPNYLSHIAGAAAVRFWTGDYAGAESALVAALAEPGRLTSNEQLGLEYMLATVQGNLEEEYRTAAAQGGSDPFRVYGHGLAAVRTNRAREALAVFEAVDFDSPLAQLNAPLWAIPPVAYHALGDYPQNLAAARRALVSYPTDLGVLNLAIAPAAAMGDTQLLDSLLTEALDMTGAFEVPPTDTPGWSILLAGLELSAHGHAEAAEEVFTRSVSWYEDELSRRPDDQVLAFASAIARYYGGDLDVLPLFAAWREADPDNIDYMGFVGVLAARRGDDQGAAAVSTRLAAMDDAYRFGQHTRWRARIAALRGDTDESLALLRESFSQGISLHFGQDWAWLHIDPDLESLRALDGFRAFIAPR